MRDGHDTTGRFNYLASSIEHSLHRNGRVLTRRDRQGSDAGTQGVEIERRNMTVHDVRAAPARDRPTVERNGFELVDHATAHSGLDFLDHAQVVGRYYDECADLVRESTGAGMVAAFDHNVRSAQGKQSKQRIAGGQEVQAPAHIVHGDYTLASAPQRLRDLAQPPTGNDTLRPFLAPGASLLDAGRAERALDEGGRFAIINVWRSIAPEPVATHPLALCDAQTVEPPDLVVFEIHYADRIGENYFAKHAARHRWCYVPGLDTTEAVLIKQWDSSGTLARTHGAEGDAADGAGPCSFSFHSAFHDPNTPRDAPDRVSIEVRCAVLYD